MSRSATERIDDIEDAVRRILSAELKLDEADGTDDSGLFFDAILYRHLQVARPACAPVPPGALIADELMLDE